LRQSDLGGCARPCGSQNSLIELSLGYFALNLASAWRWDCFALQARGRRFEPCCAHPGQSVSPDSKPRVVDTYVDTNALPCAHGTDNRQTENYGGVKRNHPAGRGGVRNPEAKWLSPRGDVRANCPLLVPAGCIAAYRSPEGARVAEMAAQGMPMQTSILRAQRIESSGREPALLILRQRVRLLYPASTMPTVTAVATTP
jgi:hypothetical protein